MKLCPLLVAVAALAAVAAARGGSYYPPPPDVQPVWSPDGTQLAYYRFADGIRVVNADGSGDRRIPNLPLTPQYGFSPDFRQVAYVVFLNTPNAYSLEVAD